ncbi:glycosyltransferase family 9 protein [Bdellovibrio sp. HCB337]|uniref:glycosyltransferase family 9 protein n=1 Tax=Bdellovibrio sp. HCB337 TaxID=3394358 RepID=UPI0039A4FB81
MMILGISLLRLGDLILQKPLIEGLRKKHPQSEIHLLINKQFSQVEFLFEGLVDRFIYFDRESLQKSCGEKEYNILWGYHQLKSLVDDINKNTYETVYNFTHNRLTAHLAGMINSSNKVGIYSVQGQFYGLTNPWIQFFNNYFGRPEATGFHYTELLARALEIPLQQPSIKWKRPHLLKTILIQPLTSDVKKNWSLQKYKALAERLQQETGYQVKVLGAPFEKAQLSTVFDEKDLYICDFNNAAKALQDAALLVTGDTSVKHLAALYDVPILELSLGSSQPLQVGAYSNNAVILQPRVACGPCPHSSPCSQRSHLCGESLDVEPVFESARMLLNLERTEWLQFSQKNPDLNVLRTEIGDLMGWTIQCLSLAQKNQFEQVIQKKTMIVEELNRRHQAVKGASNEQRTRKLPDSGAEAS